MGVGHDGHVAHREVEASWASDTRRSDSSSSTHLGVQLRNAGISGTICCRPSATGAVTRSTPARRGAGSSRPRSCARSRRRPSRAVHELLTRFGQAHAARGAAHQRHARGLLQFGDALAHGGLADARAAVPRAV